MKNSLLLCLLLIPLGLHAAPTNADDQGVTRLSRSVDHGKLEPEQLEQQLANTEFNVQAPLSTESRTSTRALPLATQSGLYWLYVYDTEVGVDYDRDGYYSRFTLSFEPEVMAGYDRVYADIYLSYEGRTWDYLTSTSVHRISAAGGSNVINITSELDYGYPPGEYDVLIELRDAYTDRLLVSAGPDTEGALGFLPLEDSEYDSDSYNYGIGVDYYAYGSGSLGLSTLLIGGSILGFRRIQKTVQF